MVRFSIEAFDCDDVGESKCLSPGLGKFKIKAVYDDKISKKAEPMLQIDFDIMDCNNKVGEWSLYIVAKNAQWKIAELLKAVNKKELSKTPPIDFSKLIGLKGRCEVFMREYRRTDGGVGIWHDVSLIPHDEARAVPVLSMKKLNDNPTGLEAYANLAEQTQKAKVDPVTGVDPNDDIPF